MLIVRPKIWSNKPPVGVSLNTGHPLTNGLVFAMIANEQNVNVRDVYSGIVATPILSPTWTPRGIDFAGSAYLDFPSIPDSYFLGDITLIWQGIVRTGSAFRHFMGKHIGNGGVTNPFDFRTTNLAIPELNLGRANTAIRLWKSPVAITLNALQQYAVTATATIETAPTFYINGVPSVGISGGSGTGTGAPTGTNANLWMGKRPVGAVQMDGVCEYAIAYNRMLSAAEIQQLYINPYAVFKTPVRRYWAASDVIPPTILYGFLGR